MTDHEKANILMVDDQPAKLLSYEVILGDLGENLIKVTSGREALDQLLKNDIAVVLMDVSMPEIDGFELADMIRQHPRFQKTAIIFISGVHLTDSDRIKGYKRGGVDYISVPVVPEVLRAKVSVFTELHHKTRQLERLNRELENRVEERTEELRESEDQFRTLANSIPQLAWMANADGSIFWYNQRWYEYTGTSFEDLEGFGWRKVHHPEHLDRVEQGLRHSWATGSLWEDTFPLQGADGEYRWFLTRAVPIFDSHGKVARWFGTGTDISSQIAAEEQIRKLNSQLEQRVTELETIMSVLPVGIAVAHDPACDNILGNAALVDLFRAQPGANLSANGERIQRLPFEFFQNGNRLSSDRLPLQRATASRAPVGSSEMQVRFSDGDTKHLLASASPLFDEKGSVRGAVGAFFDVSDRKHMEDTLRERADLLELATEAVMVRDMNGILQFWNAGAEALYGWKREEVIGKHLHRVLGTVFPVPVAEIEASLNSTGMWEGNLVQHTKDGREITVACRKALKESKAVLEINRDITSHLQAEEALRQTEKLAAMGRVAGIIAHEINNPLEAITNAFYLLRDHPSLDEEAQQYAQLAEQELHRVSHITRQTLSFYRESKQPIKLSIPDLLDNVLELQARTLMLNQIALQKRYVSGGALQGYPVELKQVFLNLIGNAIQAMPKGGQLRVRVHEATAPHSGNRGIAVAITDTGMGIRPEDARRLFEPFFSTKSVKGTGLGLWISKGIIQKYEGTISFRSVAQNGRHTTCFRVFVPSPAIGATSELEGQSEPHELQTVSERKLARGNLGSQ